MASPSASQDPPKAEADTQAQEETVVTPWDVKGIVDYNKLTEQFGSTKIDDALIQRFERLTGKPAHHWLRRGLFFSHRFETTIRIIISIL